MTRRRALSTVKFDVDLVALPRRDGGTEQRGVVVHPGAVIILPLLDDGRVVMIRNRRFAIDKTLLELPAGTLEPGEDPGLCASRELEEETGYSAGQIEPLCRFYTTPGFCDEVMHAFVATKLTPLAAGPALEPTEQITVELVAFEEALQRVASGAIDDGKSMTVLLYYARVRS